MTSLKAKDLKEADLQEIILTSRIVQFLTLLIWLQTYTLQIQAEVTVRIIVKAKVYILFQKFYFS